MKRVALLTAALLWTLQVFAHGPNRGPHGGMQVDAGDYHVEMVALDKTLTLYVNDRDDKPVDAKGYKATGIFVVDGKPQRIELAPTSANKLIGTSTVALPATLKGAITITLPNGKIVQAKY